MYPLKIRGMELPLCYVCADLKEAKLARSKHLSYIVWKGEKEQLIKLILLPIMEQLLPAFDWREYWGIQELKRPCVYAYHEPQEYYAEYDEPCEQWDKTGLSSFIGTCTVNLSELDNMALLPPLPILEIPKMVKGNLEQEAFYDGYNKKLNLPVGRYKELDTSDNLIIIDASSTMADVGTCLLGLIATMKERLNAHVIITAGISKYYAKDTELPSAHDLRVKFPKANESDMFNDILKENIFGKDWDNVIVLGDYDAPHMRYDINKQRTRVNRLWSFHTAVRPSKYLKENKEGDCAGYGIWAKNLAQHIEYRHNRDWLEGVRE